MEAGGDGSLEEESGVRMIAMFDNEEVGSGSVIGAGGTVLADAINRIIQSSAATRGRKAYLSVPCETVSW